MKRAKTYTVQFRRKRIGKTNYKKRLKLLSAKKPRLVIRKSLNNIIAQIVEYNPKGDKIILSTHSRELMKYGWNLNLGNLPSAYLVGLLIGIKAVKKNIKSAILDIGLQKSVKGSRIYAVLKGCIDAGLDIPHSPEILPTEERIKGKHIADYYSVLKKNNQLGNKFSTYEKNKVVLENFMKYFEETKNKILGVK